jgi:hypothetical protein
MFFGCRELDLLVGRAGIGLMRQNIRRRHPGKTEAEIDTLLSAWMRRADDCIPGASAQGSELDSARDALRLIEERGFHRSRNLTDALTNTWRELRPPHA